MTIEIVVQLNCGIEIFNLCTEIITRNQRQRESNIILIYRNIDMKIKERYAGILKIRDCPALLTSLTIVFKYFQFKKGRLYYRNYCARKEVFKTYLFRTYWRILFYLHRTEITVLVSSNHVMSFYNTKKNFRL